MLSALLCLLFLQHGLHASANDSTNCKSVSLDFVVQDDDALLAAIEDDIRADLAKVGINVVTRMLSKDDFNGNSTAGDFNMVFSETWGPPYDPHGYAASWNTPDEAHYAALKGMQAPVTQAQLNTKIENVLVEKNLQSRQTQWKSILTSLHEQAIDLPFSGKRIPTILPKRLAGYKAGQQQYDYPVHTLQVLSGSKTISVAPGAASGLFKTIGRLDPHTYRPNEFFANNWVYEGLVSYGAGGVIEPSLASSWTISNKPDGGQEYRFMLRQGVKFHDGSDWNCPVAKLNFDHLMKVKGDHDWYLMPAKIKTWSCAGTFEFVLTTTDGYYPLLQELCYIRPFRMLSGAMFVDGMSTDPTTNNTCCWNWRTSECVGLRADGTYCSGIKGIAGTGPFAYKATMSNGDVQFDRNADWWGGAPQVETILLKKYATAEAVMAALLDGSLDAVMGAGVLRPVDLSTIQTSHTTKFDVFLGPAIQNRFIIMNANKAPTNDLKLRKVIMHAVHKANIIDKELYGLAEPVDALFPKNAPYCRVDVTPRWDYDIEKARMLNCPEPPKTVTQYVDRTVTVTVTSAPTSSGDDDDDGLSVGVVIGIIAGVVVVCLIAVVACFMVGKQQGVAQQKLLQEKQGGPAGSAVGKPGENVEI